MATKETLRRRAVDSGRRPYGLALLVAADQFVNTLLGGEVDETLSSRIHRTAAHSRRWARLERLVDALFWWDRQGDLRHCALAYQAELQAAAAWLHQPE